MKRVKFLALSLLTILSFGALQAKEECAPEVKCLIKQAPYNALFAILEPNVTEFGTLVQTLEASGNDCTVQATKEAYAVLFEFAQKIAGAVPGGTGRIVVTESDGTVIVDTGKSTNSCDNWQAKTVNENHNSRVAIFDAQAWPCGLGAETKFSSSVKVDQNYVAIRMGVYLHSIGTVRISANAA